MCGIAVVWHPSPTIARQRCRAATEAMAHRGPDDAGLLSIAAPEGTLVLGHRRLSILDLSPAGAQPMLDNRTANAISFNGEIYNFRALRKDLEAQGHRFRGHSDTEVLLLGYAEWGSAVFDRARGMFAVALWDAGSKCLLLARDHAGMKPLYWTIDNGVLLAVSEVRAGLASGALELVIDRAGLAGLLAYGSVPEPRTIIQGLRMLPAGSCLKIDLRRSPRVTMLDEFWKLPTEVDPPASRQDLRHLLDRSVAMHLESDVPVGVFLSSGIDSTAVAESAARQVGGNLRTFTVGFSHNVALDEAAIAEQTALRLGTEHQTVYLSDEDAIQQAEAWTRAIDQPCLDGFNTYLVSRAARAAGLKVALSGLGGDELFGGYSTFRRIQRLWPYARLVRLLPRRVRSRLAAVLLCGAADTVRRKGMESAADADSLPALVLRSRRLFSDYELRRFGLIPTELGLTESYLPFERPIPPVSVANDIPAAVAVMEAEFYMRDTLLRDSDVSGMSHGLEIRMPLLDRDLMDVTLRLPKRWRMERRGGSKPMLVAAAGPRTLEVSAMPKRGFSLPYAEWLHGPLRHLFQSGLDTVSREFVLPSLSLKSFGFSSANATDRTIGWSRFWTLGVLGLWYRKTLEMTSPRHVTVHGRDAGGA